MKEYDFLIVGAGLFGATFAYKARNKGKKCLVIDKRPHLGGNIYCENIDGINVHKYGAHIFHTSNKEVWNFVNSIVEFNRYTNSPVANYKGKLYNLPFNMNTFYQIWGVTTPEEAKKFVEQTGVDSLAVSIGTAHGEYKGIPHLNFERLQEIATEVSIPLVLHGGSGSGDENLSKAVELGIAKVNICTDLLNAARDNTKDGYAERSYYDSVTLAKDGFKDCLKHYYEVFHTK